MSALADLKRLRDRGVRLWTECGQLRYEAPKGALTPEDLRRLRDSRTEMLALLRKLEPTVAHRPPQPDKVAPLSFSQQAHWNLYRLSERPSIRQIACATRIRGRLELEALRESIAQLQSRHSVLRTRIYTREGSVVQEVRDCCPFQLEVVDLTSLPTADRETQVIRCIERFILTPVDVAREPLFGGELLKLQTDEHVLVLALEHMISDMFSLGILLRELFAVYARLVKGQAFPLPEVPLQFIEYARRQAKGEDCRTGSRSAGWDEWLARGGRFRFPREDTDVPSNESGGWGTVPFRIPSPMKTELREWCRTRHTTLVMSVFAAYVALVLRWCGERQGVVRLVTDGRSQPELQNTIGYFAATLCLPVELRDDDTLLTLLRRVTAQYCEAYERTDLSRLEAQVPRPEVTRSPCFNWIPQNARLEIGDLAMAESPISCTAVPFEHPMIRTLDWDAEPVTVLFETEDEVRGGVHFPLNRFSVGTMERFGRNFAVFLHALSVPEQRVKDIVLQ